ncbi:cytochrome P450 [Bosea sp. PAMC 26642]|uniref:cytochrome P450 n=1 Tax=Bosea sp. (strain PAMC 26642) TaxID=1792307 RepID=UPI0012E7CBBC
MPFGAGARHCIGRHQAEYLLTRFLSTVIREFELVPVHDVAVTFSATVSVTPSRSLGDSVSLSSRSPRQSCGFSQFHGS